MTETKQLYSIQDVSSLSGLSVPTINRYIRAGKMPPAIRLSARCIRWPRELIMQWLRGEWSLAVQKQST